jgi:magnesium transporter
MRPVWAIMAGMGYQKISGEKTTWVDITDATLHDVSILRRFYPQLTSLNLEDILSPIERPKVDENEDYLFVVMQFPVWDARRRLSRASEVDFFIGSDFIITVHDGDLRPLSLLFQSVQKNRVDCTKLLGKTGGHSFYVMVDHLVDYMFPILSKVDSNIHYIEDSIFTSQGENVIREIALVRRDTLALRRIIRQQVAIMQQFERIRNPLIHEDLDEYFGDILDHALRARDIIDENVEVISGLSETADTLFTHRLNGVIRILTIFSVIMLPLTFVTSLYGMNIELPFQESEIAFELVMLLMVVILISMITFFRLRRWL